MGVEEAVKEAPKAAMDIIALLRDLVFYLGLMTPACFEDLVRLLLPLLSCCLLPYHFHTVHISIGGRVGYIGG